MIFILEIFCAFLISMSFIFISIQLRAKFDRSFLIFGIANLLICSFCAIDIWVQPHAGTLHWTRFQHVLASFFPPFLVWHIMMITRKEKLESIKVLFLISLIFAVLFFDDIMLKPSDAEVISTTFYNVTFAPYIIGAMVALIIMIATNLKYAYGFEKRLLRYHLFGLMILCLGGMLDMVALFVGKRVLWFMPSFTILGTLGFSFIITLIFTEKLATIVREREITFKKLREAYRELEEVQALKELGQSTAIINHEIRNYATAISGYSEMLGMNASLDDQSKKLVGRIGECITRMTSFSKEILEFSKSKILKDKVSLNLCNLIHTCIETHFSDLKHSFILGKEFYSDIAISVSGEWSKLEQVFLNIFKNAFEAGASWISVKISQRDSVLLCIVEDDGIGCTGEQLGNIFKSFYTTKKETGGTGLGMCVVRSIIEVHGGHISAYTKNSLGNKQHGLSLHITFPRYRSEVLDTERKQNIILIKEGLGNLAALIRVFQNVMVNPHIFQSMSEIDQRTYDLKRMTVLAAPCSIGQFRKKYGTMCKVLALVRGDGNSMFIVDESGNEYPSLFCEDYLLNLIATGSPGR